LTAHLVSKQAGKHEMALQLYETLEAHPRLRHDRIAHNAGADALWGARQYSRLFELLQRMRRDGVYGEVRVHVCVFASVCVCASVAATQPRTDDRSCVL
jgi:hypothetical protein